jgi:chemotaxis protein methyltransferase CheR
MAAWSSPAMAAVADLVQATTGMVFPEARVKDVESTIHRIMARRGLPDASALVDLLRRDDVEREALVADLTIGETYFQRDPAQFTLLSDRILPALLARPDRSRPVRVWSAGCASGEEPYTVAMLFDELSALDRAQIFGTDIARQRLQDAQRGIYSRWSLRATPADIRQRYFRERGRYFELRPALREHVDFRYLNLAEDTFPSLSIGIWGMDVILCRNVLIYFDSRTVERVARRLIASLSEDGWLILGASDPAISEMVACDVVLTDAGLIYRRPGAAGAANAPGGHDWRTPHEDPGQRLPPWVPPARDARPAPGDPAAVHGAAPPDHAGAVHDADGPADGAGPAAPTAANGSTAMPDVAAKADTGAAILAAYAARDFDSVADLAGASPSARLDEKSWTLWLRALANQGLLHDAGRVAAAALAAEPASAELLYLHAVLMLQAGRFADAAAALRRALYLDRSFIVAHVTLADALQRSGDMAGARRSLRNAAALLSALPGGDNVPASDGEKAGRMVELVRVKLRLLDEAA